MRVLVTGAAGFVGSHYVRTLLSGGYPGYEDARVTALDKLTYAGNLANLAPVAANPKLTFVTGDLCDGALLRAYHISGDAELTNKELTAAILEACGATWDMVVPVADRKGHDRRYSLDDKLLRSMGYAPRIPFTEGLRSTIAWYAANRGWWQPLDRPAPPAITPAGRPEP